MNKELAALKAEIGPGLGAARASRELRPRALQLALGTLRRLVAENSSGPVEWRYADKPDLCSQRHGSITPLESTDRRVRVLVVSGISATAGDDRPDADALLELPAEEDRGQATCSMRWLIVRCLPTR